MSTIHQAREAYVLGADEGGAVWLLGELHLWKATGAATAGAYALMENRVGPGAEPPPHIHHREDEAWYVLEGELIYRVGDRELPASAGSFVFAPRGVPHSFTVRSPGPARLLVVVSPAGFEGFSEEMGRPAETLSPPPPAPPDMERLAALAAKYGLELAGPPPGH